MTRGRTKDVKSTQTPEFMAAGKSKVTCISHKDKTDEEGGTGFRIEPPRRGIQQNGYGHASSMVHPSVANTEWNRGGGSIKRQTNTELKSRISQTGASSGDSCRRVSNRDYSTVRLFLSCLTHFSYVVYLNLFVCARETDQEKTESITQDHCCLLVEILKKCSKSTRGRSNKLSAKPVSKSLHLIKQGNSSSSVTQEEMLGS